MVPDRAAAPPPAAHPRDERDPVLSVTDLRELDTATADLSRVIPRADVDVASVVPRVTPIIDRVRDGGEQALLDLAEQFDGVRPPALRVPAEALAAALEDLDPTVRAALEESIARARRVHAAQIPAGSTVELGEGAVVENRWVPVERVGLYVPGGRAVYPSSVVMNVVPAQAAGVESLVVTSPPRARCWAWTRSTPPAARRPWPCWRSASARTTARAGSARPCGWSRGRATCTSPRPSAPCRG